MTDASGKTLLLWKRPAYAAVGSKSFVCGLS